MSWNASFIIINTNTHNKVEDIIKNIGFSSLVKVGEKVFDEVVNPAEGKLYIGTYLNNIIITSSDLPGQLLTNSLSNFELQLIDIFPTSEICSISLIGSINYWGFAIIKNGEKIRVKAGDSQRGTVIDTGEPMHEELELLSKSVIDKNGKRRYYLFGNVDEPLFEDQVGENFIFQIVKRYTGNLLDESDELLYDTMLDEYEISQPEKIDFSGEWKGYFSFGEGYKESLVGKKENFIMNLELYNGELTGTCADRFSQNDYPANIQGFIADNFICFLKHYSVAYTINKNGNIKASEKISNPIAYTGIFDSKNESFRGIWKIETTSYWGEWKMNKS